MTKMCPVKSSDLLLDTAAVVNWNAIAPRIMHTFKRFAQSALNFRSFLVLSALGLLLLIMPCMKNSFAMIMLNEPHYRHEIFGVCGTLF